MRPIFCGAFAVCAGVILSACSSSIHRAETASVPDDAFARALQNGYLAMARSEINENDFADADIFATRALKAANGKPSSPEKLGARRLPAEKISEVAIARDRLVAALDRGVRKTKPADAARAQLAFDCWVQEQEENFQASDIARCRQDFYAALSTIDFKPVAKALVKKPAAVPASINIAPVDAQLKTKFTVYFEFDSTGLTVATMEEITRAADAARRTGAAMVRITGHADRAGPKGHNLSLSRHRAREVAKALRHFGLPEIGVATQAYGEEQPVVRTDDGIREPRNRRVEIELTH